MFTRPADLSDDVVAVVVQEAWALRIQRIDYAPVGFGSYHWHAWADVDRWFVTADDLVAGESHLGTSRTERTRRLTAALCTARVLRDDGMTFVIAPTPTVDGGILRTVEERWAVALYPFIDGWSSQSGAYTTNLDRRAAVELLAALHETSGTARDHAMHDDFAFQLAMICCPRSPTCRAAGLKVRAENRPASSSTVTPLALSIRSLATTAWLTPQPISPS
jgi:spectinomycin phosphotransferase/16S rRNA (guanine(1405)-N(7))-methyltransferase